ncbi:uncharacterized protein EV154DRAFT_505348 [Mucor mucedo]|uniref:uncharacterized protein n=1 Tax=Mucor mucedo TaxID=29922 RepID=UPI00221F4EF9|nr:uncharacterized protein EV154DRAFT_505348 [Mucor mucedo]KAI7892258.1 hypothetical protein EV154DRAFT_505348 [Mucor mucedo]
MTDLSNEINLITSRLTTKLQTLEADCQRWTDYKTDYDALETQLKTLPDTTSRSAMIPLGKLAFMPGKLIHTNEILVLLGDQYYAERSAKQAIDILGRRREVVHENLRLAEAQLNSFKQKTGPIIDAGVLPATSDPQLNEEGLPIMDIREELPSDYDEKEKEKKRLQAKAKKTPSTPTNQLPESVLRARQLMKEADEKIKQQKKEKEDEEDKALFELLRDLEEEEEEEGAEVPIVTPSQKSIAQQSLEEEEDDSSLSDEEDDRYDTEIAENMFDRFADDEEYPLDGVVDQEDFSCYDEPELPPQIPAATIEEITEEDEINERSTPKLITKRKTKPVEQQQESVKEETPVKDEAPKKMSKFKLAQLEKKNSVESVVKENVTVESSKQAVEKPKKFSKFKLLRQQQQEQPRPQKIESPVETKVKEVVVDTPIEIPQVEEEYHPEESIETMMVEPKKPQHLPVENNGIPKVIAKPKKMSRFKLARQKKVEPEKEEVITPVKVERVKPKRTVTWDSNTSVRDHDNTLAPSVVSETASYSQPMKSDQKRPQQKVRSASDIFRVVQRTQDEAVDDYPSLDDDSETKVDLNELIKVARESSEAFWRPNDGTEALIPMVNGEEDTEEEEEEEPEGIIVAKKNKLDNKIMKGAVMERDMVPVDFEAVEEDMDIREITSSYQQMRQNMLATTGGLSFATKPEFEVFDEELPLPKQKGQEEEEEVQPAPRKMSRFKAARLGMQLNEEGEYE